MLQITGNICRAPQIWHYWYIELDNFSLCLMQYRIFIKISRPYQLNYSNIPPVVRIKIVSSHCQIPLFEKSTCLDYVGIKPENVWAFIQPSEANGHRGLERVVCSFRSRMGSGFYDMETPCTYFFHIFLQKYRIREVTTLCLKNHHLIIELCWPVYKPQVTNRIE